MAEEVTRVLLVRPEGPDRDAHALAARGLLTESDAYIAVGPCTDPDASSRANAVLAAIAGSADWLVVTSHAAVDALAAITSAGRLRDAIVAGSHRGLRFAAVGPVAAGSLTASGATEVIVPAQQDADGLVSDLLRFPAAKVIVPVGNLVRPVLADGLRAHGWTVEVQTVYDTATVATRPPTADRLGRGEFDVVVLRSPSAVAAVKHFVPALPAGLIAVCGGPTTAAAAREAGFATIVVSVAPSAQAVADAVTRATAQLAARGSDGSA